MKNRPTKKNSVEKSRILQKIVLAVLIIGYTGLLAAWMVMHGHTDQTQELSLPTVENAADAGPPRTTYIAKHDGRYYIALHAQDRLLTSKTLNPNINKWNIVDDSISDIHSFAFHENWMVADHTNADCVRVYRIGEQTVRRVQDICDLPKRPHRTIWDPKDRVFWMLSANSNTIHKFGLTGDADAPLRLLYKQQLPFLKKSYARSMVIVDGLMYFVSGPESVIAARHQDNTFDVAHVFPAPGFNGRMIDIFQTSDKWWYVTAEFGASGKIIRMRSLNDLQTGKYEDVTAALHIPKGVWPYYLSEFDGKIWLPYNSGTKRTNGGIISFQHAPDGAIVNMEILYDKYN